MSVVPRVGGMLATGLLGGGFALALSDEQTFATSLGVVTSICGAFLWIGRMIWTSSRIQTTILEQIKAQGARLEQHASHQSELGRKVDENAKELGELREDVAGVVARFDEHARLTGPHGKG